MTSHAQELYALSLDQITLALKAGSRPAGRGRTMLVQGHTGTGKSTLLKELAADPDLKDYYACYFDCTTKDLGDITIPKLKELDGSDYVTFATNEELGAHLSDRPIILMIDEYGKANRAVKNSLLRLMLEGKIGSHTLHEDSIVFATTNLGAEGLGDVVEPHARNRITIVRSRKPTADEWIAWGINNDVDHVLLHFVKETPQLFQTFDEVSNPDDNHYIFHPQAKRESFVTPRSLEAASDWMKHRDKFDDNTLTSLLIGTIGPAAAMDLMSHVKLADQMPSLESIKKSPQTAKVPESAAAVVMVVYRTLTQLDNTWVNAWMEYLVRLDKEAQGYFVNGVRDENYKNRKVVFSNSKFAKWAMENNYMYSADKK